MTIVSITDQSTVSYNSYIQTMSKGRKLWQCGLYNIQTISKRRKLRQCGLYNIQTISKRRKLRQCGLYDIQTISKGESCGSAVYMIFR